MRNWALRDFKKEAITGQFIRFAHGDGGGPVIEVRLSRARHFQFVVWCPDCKFSKLLPSKYRAKRTLYRHLRSHRKIQGGIGTDDPSQSKNPQPIKSGKHRCGRTGVARKKRKDVWKTRSIPGPLGNRSFNPGERTQRKRSGSGWGR